MIDTRLAPGRRIGFRFQMGEHKGSQTQVRPCIRSVQNSGQPRGGGCPWISMYCFSLLLSCGRGGGLGLARLGKTKLLVLDALPLQQGGYGPGRDRADVEPVAAAVHLQQDLLGLVLVRGVVIAEFLDDAAIAGNGNPSR